jgi:hypothetical protein
MSIFFLMILFVALSPGMFLSIPSVGGRWWMTGKMSLRAVFVHAAVFAIILWLAGLSGAEGFAPTLPLGVEGFAPNVTNTSVNWMLPRIRDAKSINDPNIQSILRRIAVEESTLTYDAVRKATLPALNTKEDIQNLESAIKVAKSIPSSKVEDAKVSYDLLQKRVLPELFSKFNPDTVAQELRKIGSSLPEKKNIDAISKLGPQSITSMQPGGITVAPITGMRSGSVGAPSMPAQIRSGSVGAPSMVNAQFAPMFNAPSGSYIPPPPRAAFTGSSSFFTQYIVYPLRSTASAMGF